MKTFSVTIENAVHYHEPDERKPSSIIRRASFNAAPDTYPVPVPTETSIPEIADDFVLFELKDTEGRVLFQMAVSNYFQFVGKIDNVVVVDKMMNVRPQEKSVRESR